MKDYLKTVNELLNIIDVIKSSRIITYLEKTYPLLIGVIKKAMEIDFVIYNNNIKNKELKNA